MTMEAQVFSIREAATLNLQKLAAEFGPDWAKEHLVPQARILGWGKGRVGYFSRGRVPELGSPGPPQMSGVC